MGQAAKARAWSIDERRTEVAKLLCKGWSNRRIAEHLGVGAATISRDSEVIAAEWAETRIRAIDHVRAVDLEKLASVESAALEIVETEADPDIKLRGLTGVVKTQERRAKLLGLDAAIEVQVTQRMSAEVSAMIETLRGQLSDAAFAEVIAALGGGSEEGEAGDEEPEG
jgi:transposase